jgi:hypothetical protein
MGAVVAWSVVHVRFRVKVEHGGAGCEAPNKELPRIVVRRGTFSGLPAPSPTLLSSGNHGARSVPPLR